MNPGNSVVIPHPDKYSSLNNGGSETELLFSYVTWFPVRFSASSHLKRDKIAFKSIAVAVFKSEMSSSSSDLRFQRMLRSTTEPWVLRCERSSV